MPEYTDPTTVAAQAVPGELGLSADFNTYALNNVEAVGTAVADTITDLEDHWGGSTIAQRSGRFGYVRTGSSLYDFIPLVYDEDVSRWVSQTYSWGSSGHRPDETTSANHMNYVLRRSAAGTNLLWGPLIPYSGPDAAGLNPEFRWLWVVQNASGSTWTVTRMVQSLDIGEEFDTVGTAFSSSTGTQSDPTLQGDSETTWIAYTPTIKEYICPGIRLQTTASTVSTLWSVTFLWRWVSA